MRAHRCHFSMLCRVHTMIYPAKINQTSDKCIETIHKTFEFDCSVRSTAALDRIVVRKHLKLIRRERKNADRIESISQSNRRIIVHLRSRPINTSHTHTYTWRAQHTSPTSRRKSLPLPLVDRLRIRKIQFYLNAKVEREKRKKKE